MELQFTANTIAQRKPTLVDLSELEYIASLGLRMLITAAKALLRHGLKLVPKNRPSCISNPEIAPHRLSCLKNFN
ncbi:MAG: hypothetical protein P8X46_01815 [Nitrospirales bacterium]